MKIKLPKLPISNKKHEQVLTQVEEIAALSIRTTEAAKKRTDDHLTRTNNRLAEVLGDYANLITKYDSLCELNSARTRIGFITVDAIEIESRLRSIEPTIKVEFDGKKLFIYADRLMTTPEINQLEGMLKVQIDRT